MKPAHLKVFGWSLLCMGLGGLGLNATLLLSIIGARLQPVLYGLLAICIGFVSLALFLLRRAYRAEPTPKRGAWQITLLEMMVVSMFTGAVLTLAASMATRLSLILFTPALLFGFIFATQNQITVTSQRLLFGLGAAAWISGCVCMGGMTMITLEAMWLDRLPLSETLQFLLAFFMGQEMHGIGTSMDLRFEMFTLMVRTAVIGMPVGLLITYLIRSIAQPNKPAAAPNSLT